MLSINKAAKVVGISRETLRGWLNSNDPPPHRVNTVGVRRQYLIPEAGLREWMNGTKCCPNCGHTLGGYYAPDAPHQADKRAHAVGSAVHAPERAAGETGGRAE